MKSISYREYLDRISACWYGKSLGGIIGAPYECHKQFRETSTEQLWPAILYPNDDLDIQVVYLEALQEMGPWIDSGKLARYWKEHCFYNCCEYGVFLDNFDHGIMPPLSGIWNNSWHCASMGCPIRSELWGILGINNPALAAEYAGMDGVLDHGPFSVEVEKFWSAAASLAFFADDFPALVAAVLAIPEIDSSVRGIVTEVQKICADHPDSHPAWREVIRRFGHRNATSARTNFALTLMALFLGKGDFKEVMRLCVQSGWDADCTAATAGALLGLMYGTRVLPPDLCEKMGKNLVCACEIPHQFAPLADFAEETARLGVEMAALRNPQITFTDAPEVPLHPAPAPEVTLLAVYPEEPVLRAGGSTPVTLKVCNPLPEALRGTLVLTLPEGTHAEYPETVELPAGKDAEIALSVSASGIGWINSKNLFHAELRLSNGCTAHLDFGLQGARQWKIYGPYWNMWDKKRYPVCPYDNPERVCNPGNLLELRDAMDMYAELDTPFLDEAALLQHDLPEEAPMLLEKGGDTLGPEDFGGFCGTSCCYFVTEVRSATELKGVWPCIGANVPCRLWIDGKLLWEQRKAVRKVSMILEGKPLDFQPGVPKRVVIKLALHSDAPEFDFSWFHVIPSRTRGLSPFAAGLSFRASASRE